MKMMKRMVIDSQVVVAHNSHCSFDSERSFDLGDCNDDRTVDVDDDVDEDDDDCREANETTGTNCCSTSHPQSIFSNHHSQSGLCWWLRVSSST